MNPPHGLRFLEYLSLELKEDCHTAKESWPISREWLQARLASYLGDTDAYSCAESCHTAKHSEEKESPLHRQKHHTLSGGVQPFFDTALLPASCCPTGSNLEYLEYGEMHVLQSNLVDDL